MVSKINGLVITDPYKWGMNWGCNPLTNHLLTSRDIQVKGEGGKVKGDRNRWIPGEND